MGASPPDEPYGVRDFKAEFGGNLGVKWLKKRQTLGTTLKTLKDSDKERKRLKTCTVQEKSLPLQHSFFLQIRIVVLKREIKSDRY